MKTKQTATKLKTRCKREKDVKMEGMVSEADILLTKKKKARP